MEDLSKEKYKPSKFPEKHNSSLSHDVQTVCNNCLLWQSSMIGKLFLLILSTGSSGVVSMGSWERYSTQNAPTKTQIKLPNSRYEVTENVHIFKSEFEGIGEDGAIKVANIYMPRY